MATTPENKNAFGKNQESSAKYKKKTRTRLGSSISTRIHPFAIVSNHFGVRKLVSEKIEICLFIDEPKGLKLTQRSNRTQTTKPENLKEFGKK